jgi:hypothetical protein
MSEDEKYAAQGRAHARAKELRSGIAAATVELNRHTAFLEEVPKRTRSFLKEPTSGSPVPIGTALVHDLRFNQKDTLAVVANLLEDIYRDTMELRGLEEQIKAF